MKQRPPRLLPHHSKLRKLLLVFALPAILFSLVWNFPSPVASHSSQDGIEVNDSSGPENYDIRSSLTKAAQIKKERRQQRLGPDRKEKKANRGQRMKAARARLAEQVNGLRIKENDLIEAPEIVSIASKHRKLTSRSAEAHDRIVRRFLESNEDLYGLSLRQIARLRKMGEYSNPAGNLSWVSLEQVIHDIPVFQGELRATLTSEGELVQTTGSLAPDVEDKGLSDKPDISAAEAIAKAAETIGLAVNPGDLTLKESLPGGQSFIFGGGPFADDTKIELVYFPMESGLVELGWSMTLWQDPEAFYIIVGAEDGELFFRKNITDYQTQPATYSYYNDDSPGPLSPSSATPGSGIQGALIPRTLITLISEHPLNDPWLLDGATTTTGNNVDSGMDLVSPNGVDPAGRPVSASRTFDFPYTPGTGLGAVGDSPTLPNYRFGEAVNMFVWTNRYHDRLYQLGFTESARNFQQNNFGRGGLGNDRVLAEGQDFSGTNNANFNTPVDGSPGRMQMYIFTGPTPDRSSGLDQEILIHELTHGTSNRLHANASGLGNTMSGGMGEGWSDFYARALLSTADEDVNGIYAAGAYSTLAISTAGFVDNFYYGIRRFPYAVKSNVGANGKPHNPLTFADIDPTQINVTDGAFPRGPIGSSTAFQVHNIGEVWCMTLLEMRARLITRNGHAVGNQQALQLVTDGMKLDPANPTLVDGRNSILAANCAAGGPDASATELDIWQGFATRGLGFSASAVSSSSSSVKEAFDTPNLTLGAISLSNDTCDLAGFADPGETVTLNVPLSNPFCATNIEGVSVSILGGGTAGYGTIAAGTTVAQALSFTVAADAACGTKIDVPIEISSSLGTITRTYTLQVGAPTSAVSANYSSGNIAAPIPDFVAGVPGVVEIPINVTDSGALDDINVRVRLNHTFDGDLVLTLIGPDGTTVNLSNNRGVGGDNFGSGANNCSGTHTTFDDEAATAIGSGVAPFAASFRPDSPLSAFDGKERNGTWKLRVTDTAGVDVGTVGCVQLDMTDQLYYCCGVPGLALMQAAPPATVVAESVVPSNGAPDPDETVTMSFPLKNIGTGLTTNLVATLQPGGGVNAPSSPQNYGILSPIGPAVARDFTFVASGACGSNITATFHLQDGAVDLGTATFLITLGAPVISTPLVENFDAVIAPALPSGWTTTITGAVTPWATTTTAGFFVSSPNGAATGSSAVVSQTILISPPMAVPPAGTVQLTFKNNFSLETGFDGGVLEISTNGGAFTDIIAAGGSFVSGGYNRTISATFSNPIGGRQAWSGTGTLGSNGFITTTVNMPPSTLGQSVVFRWRAGFDTIISPAGAGWRIDDVTLSGSVMVCQSSPCTIGVTDITQANDPGVCGAFVNFPAPTITGSCGVITNAPPSGSFFAVGTTPVAVTGTRQDGSTTPAGFNVIVNDVEQPTISNASADPSSLWPPNHKMVNVTVSYGVADNCAASAIVTSLSVTSNEPVNDNGDGNTAPDWEVIDAHHVRLRAERSGGGSGRIYTITITATDAANNTTTRTVTVRVPHDQGH